MDLRRATIGDVWAYAVEANWSPPAHEYRLLVAEAVAGRVWCGVAAGAAGAAPLMLGGVLRYGENLPGTIWLLAGPHLPRRIISATRVMRRLIAASVPDNPAGLVCAVSDRNEVGQRLARALGFVATDETWGVLRNWVFVGSEQA